VGVILPAILMQHCNDRKLSVIVLYDRLRVRVKQSCFCWLVVAGKLSGFDVAVHRVSCRDRSPHRRLHNYTKRFDVSFAGAIIARRTYAAFQNERKLYLIVLCKTLRCAKINV